MTNREIENLMAKFEELQFEDFELINYNFYPTIKAIMK